ncbi:hypothetical protein GCM10017744_037660 [Streptomyces antimycoticus]|uniref:Uncharacterized protein n=1 Tax=Streptomyces antimycoticus TaxID=68175 RepID=A0A4D4K8Y8_9ACTN|nr:hypothetical protein [Streptomyces antimycoticus]GDY45611.1 hypothetical protein SANT12839_064930 [Streptomyces antimycoticus]
MSVVGQHRSPCPQNAAQRLLGRASPVGAPLALSAATARGADDGIEVRTDWINTFG